MLIPIDEDLVPLADAVRLIPRPGGRKLHKSTIFRWATRGCRGVVLETMKCGGTRVTSRQALQRFFERLASLPERTAVTSASDKADAVTEAALDSYGI